MNRIEVIGNLGKDAEVKSVGQSNVISFSVADSSEFTDKNGERQSTLQWINCEYWRKNPNVAEYLKKGTQVLVIGELRTDNYKDKQGNERQSYKLRVSSLNLLRGKNVQADGQNTLKSQENAQKKDSPEAFDKLKEKFGLETQGGLPF